MKWSFLMESGPHQQRSSHRKSRDFTDSSRITTFTTISLPLHPDSGWKHNGPNRVGKVHYYRFRRSCHTSAVGGETEGRRRTKSLQNFLNSFQCFPRPARQIAQATGKPSKMAKIAWQPGALCGGTRCEQRTGKPFFSCEKA